MYGCTSLLHLSYRTPILLTAFGLTWFASQANNPGPGERYGTAESLTKIEHQLIRENPYLATQAVHLRASFDKLNPQPTEEQVRKVLGVTDACTDINVRDVMANPDESREVAWVLYLDTVSKVGPDKAKLIFHSPPR